MDEVYSGHADGCAGRWDVGVLVQMKRLVIRETCWACERKSMMCECRPRKEVGGEDVWGAVWVSRGAGR